jgi:hypothetical protein
VVLIIALVAFLVLAGTSPASITRVSFTAVVSPNDYARLEVVVAPRARCAIKVVYDMTVSHAKGLGPRTRGRVAWRWKVGSSTRAGRWPVTIDCGKCRKRRLRLRVTPLHSEQKFVLGSALVLELARMEDEGLAERLEDAHLCPREGSRSTQTKPGGKRGQERFESQT